MIDLSPAVQEHFTQPRRVGVLDTNAAEVTTATAGSPETGGMIRIQLKIQAGKVADARFQAFGCASTIACGSWVAQWVIGRDIGAIVALKNNTIAQALELTPLKVGCAVLAEQALHSAVKTFNDNTAPVRVMDRCKD